MYTAEVVAIEAETNMVVVDFSDEIKRIHINDVSLDASRCQLQVGMKVYTKWTDEHVYPSVIHHMEPTANQVTVIFSLDNATYTTYLSNVHVPYLSCVSNDDHLPIRYELHHFGDIGLHKSHERHCRAKYPWSKQQLSKLRYFRCCGSEKVFAVRSPNTVQAQ